MLIKRLLEFLAPSRCLNCGRDGGALCDLCVQSVGQKTAPVCFGCNLPSPAGRTCISCQNSTALEGVAVGSYYGGPVKELILQLKFHRLRQAAQAASILTARSLPGDLTVDVVTAVPISAARYRERGYNQSELLARQLAARLRLPYTPLLGRVNAVHQMGLDRQMRLEQIKGAFYPVRQLKGRRVLVVDDVITTGATLSECSEVLVGAGAGGVWGAVVARH